MRFPIFALVPLTLLSACAGKGFDDTVQSHKDQSAYVQDYAQRQGKNASDLSPSERKKAEHEFNEYEPE